MAVRSWQQKSRNKFRTNQTRFGMVSEKLSTKTNKGEASLKKTGKLENFEQINVPKSIWEF